MCWGRGLIPPKLRVGEECSFQINMNLLWAKEKDIALGREVKNPFQKFNLFTMRHVLYEWGMSYSQIIIVTVNYWSWKRVYGPDHEMLRMPCQWIWDFFFPLLSETLKDFNQGNNMFSLYLCRLVRVPLCHIHMCAAHTSSVCHSHCVF